MWSPLWVEHLSEELQSSCHELSTAVADSIYVNIYQKYSFAYAEMTIAEE